MIDINICWCGHSAEVHFTYTDECCDECGVNEYTHCTLCAESDEISQNCDHEFEQDNLRFLEELSKKQLDK